MVTANDYYPGGMLMPGRKYSATNGYRYGFNGKEKDNETHGDANAYDFGARILDSRLGKWFSVDPLAHKFPWQSPYITFDGDPINKIDPDGKSTTSTDVKRKKDGSFTVEKGKADGDRNVYVVDNKGKRTGEIIGKSLTEYSFLDEKGNGVKGAVINLKDNSGVNFLNKDIISSNLGLIAYMPNATGGEKYDFKSKGIAARLEEMTREQYQYRGMSFEGVLGFGNQDGSTLTIASARDIGNVAAGYVAGNNGLGWGGGRLGFDALESYQKGAFATEGQPTKRAQRIGFEIGTKKFNQRKTDKLLKEAMNRFPPGPKW